MSSITSTIHLSQLPMIPRTNAFAPLMPMVVHQTFSSQPQPAIVNATQSLANHASTGIMRSVNASAITMALHANQVNTGTRSIVHASVLMMMATALRVNTLIMRLAPANV